MSDQTYTVEQVLDVRDWTGNYGPMLAYDLRLAGVEDKVELSQKPSTTAPREGDHLFGHLEDGKFGKKFKKAQQQGSFNGGGGTREYKADPAKARSIMRQSAQKAALEYAALRNQQGKLPDDFNFTMLKPIVDWFYTDACEAMDTEPVIDPKPDTGQW